MNKLKMLGRVVWDIAAVEQVATSVCGVILSSQILTDHETRFLVETIRPEEQMHDDSMRVWARQFYGDRPRRRLAYAAFGQKELLYSMIPNRQKRFAYSFASLYWNEKFNLRWAPLVISIFKRFDAGFAATYERNLLRDEPRHVEWGDRVIDRIHRQDRMTYNYFCTYYDYLDMILPTIINASHMRIYQKINANS